jgi:hypothetical protein
MLTDQASLLSISPTSVELRQTVSPYGLYHDLAMAEDNSCWPSHAVLVSALLHYAPNGHNDNRAYPVRPL